MRLEPVRSDNLGFVVETIIPGVEEVLKQTRGEFTVQSIVAGLYSGRYTLWLGLDDTDDYLGYAITQIDHYPGGRQLTILQAYVLPTSGSKTLDELYPVLEAEAVARGCKWIAIYSKLGQNRSGRDWAERMDALGLTPGYVEYVKGL